jgi:hypothetical protein
VQAPAEYLKWCVKGRVPYCLQLGTLADLTFSGGQRRGLNITANSVSKVYFSLHFDANGFSDLKA